MSNIQEDCVSFEVAKLLKEKEFPQVNNIVDTSGKLDNRDQGFIYNYLDRKEVCAIPTQSLAIKWLRIEHGIHIWVDFPVETTEWIWTIHRTGKSDYIQSDDRDIEESIHSTLEECQEAAMLYTLKHLI